ncbi:methyl-accepting chemotaxis protein [Halopseudomonas oceani]|uniref:Methyl-accepting chemotaxis protein n=1 Tax=Halopseudomonas oceani TaxID=1708783 RepID=A0A2P4EVQ4_9GAMM|nr:methyl-accepting chemotaxis protein [Halopseudomonas oceani]POB03695.1 methyl-accepting chemotaxis protein [Halopseudomonas oceani]GGE47345.1 methyl-accepting chemotaxis protein [Halopseudomonas oceani]
MAINRSLRLQTLVLMAGSLALMLLVSLAITVSLANSVDGYRDLLERPVTSATLINRANLEFKTQVQEWKNVLLRGAKPADKDKYWSQFEASEQAVQNTLQQIGSLALAPEVLAEVRSLADKHRQLGARYRDSLKAYEAAGLDPTAGDRAARGIDREVSEHMDQLSGQLNTTALEQSTVINTTAARTVWTGLVLLVIAALVIGVLSQWLVNRRLVSPITQLIAQIERLSQGRLGQSVSLDRADELGTLARAANQLRSFLEDTFSQLQRSTSELDRASGELNTIATRMAHGSREQFSRTDQVATAMQEMSAAAAEVAQHAAEAARAADDADSNAQEGGQVMQATIHAMQDMLAQITQTTEVIRRLEGDSNRIGKVLDVIQGIAEQTNLLALNAAIEAARAGEAGRGFAVVADEVRTLAKRTAESTAEIQQIINDVQSGAGEAVKAIAIGQTRSESSMQQVNLAGERLTQITVAIESIRDMNRQISTAADEQTSVAEDITRNITEITDIAAANQSEVDNTARASQALHDLSGELSTLTQRLSA